jgi:hypothetical protein
MATQKAAPSASGRESERDQKRQLLRDAAERRLKGTAAKGASTGDGGGGAREGGAKRRKVQSEDTSKGVQAGQATEQDQEADKVEGDKEADELEYEDAEQDQEADDDEKELEEEEDAEPDEDAGGDDREEGPAAVTAKPNASGGKSENRVLEIPIDVFDKDGDLVGTSVLRYDGKQNTTAGDVLATLGCTENIKMMIQGVLASLLSKFGDQWSPTDMVKVLFSDSSGSSGSASRSSSSSSGASRSSASPSPSHNPSSSSSNSSSSSSSSASATGPVVGPGGGKLGAPAFRNDAVSGGQMVDPPEKVKNKFNDEVAADSNTLTTAWYKEVVAKHGESDNGEVRRDAQRLHDNADNKRVETIKKAKTTQAATRQDWIDFRREFLAVMQGNNLLLDHVSCSGIFEAGVLVVHSGPVAMDGNPDVGKPTTRLANPGGKKAATSMKVHFALLLALGVGYDMAVTSTDMWHHPRKWWDWWWWVYGDEGYDWMVRWMHLIYKTGHAVTWLQGPVSCSVALAFVERCLGRKLGKLSGFLGRMGRNSRAESAMMRYADAPGVRLPSFDNVEDIGGGNEGVGNMLVLTIAGNKGTRVFKTDAHPSKQSVFRGNRGTEAQEALALLYDKFCNELRKGFGLLPARTTMHKDLALRKLDPLWRARVPPRNGNSDGARASASNDASVSNARPGCLTGFAADVQRMRNEELAAGKTKVWNRLYEPLRDMVIDEQLTGDEIIKTCSKSRRETMQNLPSVPAIYMSRLGKSGIAACTGH